LSFVGEEISLGGGGNILCKLGREGHILLKVRGGGGGGSGGLLTRLIEFMFGEGGG
jgi:hypothetical protein